MNKNNKINTNRFDNEIFIALFRKGAHEYMENDMLDDLSDIDDDKILEFSETADKKIRKMIDKAIRKDKRKKSIKRLPRIAAIILVVIAVCSITIMSVEAFRVPFLNLFVNTEEKITDIDLEEGQARDEDNSFSDIFGYIPKGYELISEDNNGEDTMIIYTDENGESIFINRLYGEGSLGIDTENADYGEILINDQQGFYSLKNGDITLVFTKNGFTYSISGSLKLDEIIKIAENIK